MPTDAGIVGRPLSIMDSIMDDVKLQKMPSPRKQVKYTNLKYKNQSERFQDLTSETRFSTKNLQSDPIGQLLF